MPLKSVAEAVTHQPAGATENSRYIRQTCHSSSDFPHVAGGDFLLMLIGEGTLLPTFMIAIPNIALVQAWNDADLPPLFPEEEACLGNVAAKRRIDFTLGRACARRALVKLGVEPQAILRGPSREPVWPRGVCGSITHCEGYWAAALARSARFASIGIDAEPRARLPEGVLNVIASPTELAWIREQTADIPLDRLLFSAKESAFKAWFPLGKTILEFEQVEIEFDVRAKTFLALIDSDGKAPLDSPREMQGQFHVGETHVFTCCVVPPHLHAS